MKYFVIVFNKMNHIFLKIMNKKIKITAVNEHTE